MTFPPQFGFIPPQLWMPAKRRWMLVCSIRASMLILFWRRLAGFDCEAVLIKVVDLDCSDPNYLETQRCVARQLETEAAVAPRGHYAVIRKLMDNNLTVYETVVSDGRGEGPAVGGSFDVYYTMPSSEIVLNRLVGYEIF